MCLIVVTKRPTVFSPEWLTDFWKHNQDGSGFMRLEPNGQLTTRRLVPRPPQYAGKGFKKGKKVKNGPSEVSLFITAWEQEAQKAEATGAWFACHLRMATHGDINLENTHPYRVAPGVELMHNGILEHGNEEDPSLSDTWHYARKIERILAEVPLSAQYFVLDALRPIVEGDINDNRFVLAVEGHPEFILMNRKQGVEWSPTGVAEDTAWFSNTYAWSAPKEVLPRFTSHWASPSSAWKFGLDDLDTATSARKDFGLPVLKAQSAPEADWAGIKYWTWSEMVAWVRSYPERAIAVYDMLVTHNIIDESQVPDTLLAYMYYYEQSPVNPTTDEATELTDLLFATANRMTA